MSDSILGYYNRELAFLRQEGAEFARRYPKIAGRLRLAGDNTDDPLVARIVESVAFLNARIRHKLDDDFPEIAEAMLDVLYPHYLRPVPSMAIARCDLDPAQGGATGGYLIPRGTAVETDPIDGEPCRLRTCYPVTLWPIRVAAARLVGRPFEAPRTERSPGAPWLLHLRLECLSPRMTFDRLAPGSLRFFLNGKSQFVFNLYEALFVNVVEVALAADPSTAPQVLGPESLCPVGFEPDEALLPTSARSFEGYRLLTEFFAFATKFLFFDITGLDVGALQGVGPSLDLFFYLNRLPGRLEPSYITAQTFQLGCTPIVNLYKKRAEPIRLTHTESEARVIPDVRRPLAHEIYSIDRVTATSSSGKTVEYLPFYSPKPSDRAAERAAFWHSTRRAATWRDGRTDPGSEVYLTLVDLDLQPAIPSDSTLHVEATCLSRDLPATLPFGVDQPRLQLGVPAPVAFIRCLTPPTGTLRPALRQGVMWPLVSHLTLNHLSISDGEEGAEALRAILGLYDFTGSEEARSMIEGLHAVRSRRVVGRFGESGEGNVIRGVETTIEFDEDHFVGNGLFVLASVLERFLGLYCSINSFTRLVAITRQREGELKRWPARAGNRILL